MNDNVPSTELNYTERLPKHFMSHFLFGEPEVIESACDTCSRSGGRWEYGFFDDDDINLIVDICRVDHYFEECCDGSWFDLKIDTLEFFIRSSYRIAHLAHTFWGVQSHLAALGVEPNEDLSVELVKRAVSAFIKEENKDKEAASEFWKERAEALSKEQGE